MGLLPHPSPVEGDRLKLRDALFHEGAIVFDRIASQSVWYGVPGQRGIKVAFLGLPHLGIWAKPSAGFICIEPWYGYADPEGFNSELSRKPGIVLIPPGEAHIFKMTVSVAARSY